MGRADLLERMQAAWRQDGRPANISIQGNHRMGKTSLVQRAIAMDQQIRPNLVFVNLSLGSYESGQEVFRTLMSRTLKAVKNCNFRLSADRIKRLENIASLTYAVEEWLHVLGNLQDFFETLQNAGLTVSLVLDEFDYAASIFTRPADFQFLRSLASEPFSSVGLITVSRRPIKVIEMKAIGGSTLDGVLGLRSSVGLFTDSDINEMLGRAEKVGTDLHAVRDQIIDRAGPHPYLLELLCCEIVEIHRSMGVIDVSTAFKRTAQQFYDQFARLVRLIDADTKGVGRDLLHQVLSGAGRSLPPEDEVLLQRMGFLRGSDGHLQLFSDEFERYLRREAVRAGDPRD